MPTRAPSDLDPAGLARLLREQDGVVAQSQLVELGASRTDVRRLLARGKLVPVHPRVYVNPSGRPTRSHSQWAAVLACAPAALHRESALERVRDRSTWVQANRRPPRATFEYALLKTAADRGEGDAIALLSDAVHQGLTTPSRLLDAIARLPRLRRRAVLREVERAHGLPEGERQLRQDTTNGTVHRDIRYGAQRTLVELDGAFGHRDAVDRWADLQRGPAARSAPSTVERTDEPSVAWHHCCEGPIGLGSSA